jgi:hypothetical protein
MEKTLGDEAALGDVRIDIQFQRVNGDSQAMIGGEQDGHAESRARSCHCRGSSGLDTPRNVNSCKRPHGIA